MKVEWYKCVEDVWCSLFKLDLGHKYIRGLSGVYLIWAGKGEEKTILKTGLGDISKELSANAADIAIKAFSHVGVYVTWSPVSTFKRKNVCAFLQEKLKPKFPNPEFNSGPVEVNLPWE